MIDRLTEIPWTHHVSQLGSEVHVYVCDIEALEIKALLSLLTPDELAKANAFRQQADTNRFVTGRLITKKLLGFYGKIDAAAIIINKGEYGKPQATTASGMRLPLFNISHSGSKVMVACCNELVGADVEQVTGIELDSLAAAVFSDRELNLFKTADDVVTTFYSFWTRKEALLKAVGVGLVDELQLIDISEQADADFVKAFTPKQLELLTFTLHDRGKYFASLCYVKGLEVRFIEMTNELLSQL